MKRTPLFACAVAICAATVWWLGYGSDTTSTTPGAAGVALSAHAKLGAAVQGSASGADTARTIGLVLAPQSYQFRDPLLAPELRQTFEAMLLEVMGSDEIRDPARLKKLLVAAVPRYFPGALSVPATQLLTRYVDYRVALSELKAPTDASDPRALRSALDARQALRQRHFAGEEYEALFAEEARLDRYTLARIEIEQSSALTQAQKQAALKDADNELSDAQRAQRSQAVAHMDVAAQTAALIAGNTSDAERFKQRSSQYGDAAATQLAQLDRDERDWQARLDNYASAQAKKASPEQLQQLSQQLFSAPEQLRLQAALAMRGSVATEVKPR